MTIGIVENNKSVRIKQGQAISTEVDLDTGLFCGFFIPENFTGTKITVLVARQFNSEYVVADDGNGDDLELDVSEAGRYIPLKNLAIAAGHRFVKLQSDQNQSADAVIDIARLIRAESKE